MTAPVRVTLVTPGYPPELGGVEAHAGHLVRELTALGVAVRVLTARRGLTRARTEVRDGVEVHLFPAWRTRAMSISPRLLLAGLRAARSGDVVHVHSYHALCGFAAIGGLRAPVVLTPHYHGSGHTTQAAALHRVYRHLGRVLFRAARVVVCVSRAERDAVVRDFPATAPRTRVVPNGVDVAAIRAAEPWAGEPPTVLSVGRLEHYKGVAGLVRAVPALPGGVQVVVVGDGSQRAELEELAAEMGVADRVRFLGAVDAVTLHRWLRTADVLVSLSAHEAFGMAPVEAAAGGARAVLSDIPAHREIAADHLAGTAVLVDPAGAGVAAAVGQQLAAGRLGEVDVPDWAAIAATTLQIYQDVLGTRRLDHP